MSRGKGSGNRNIYITPKGHAMLAAIDAGIVRTLSTAEARARSLEQFRKAKKSRSRGDIEG